MYRIEVKPGEEAVFRTIEELATGIRNGFITPRARIYHAASQKWLPIEFHPHYKKALDGNFTPAAPGPQPSLSAMPTPTFSFPAATPAGQSQRTSPDPEPAGPPVEGAEGPVHLSVVAPVPESEAPRALAPAQKSEPWRRPATATAAAQSPLLAMQAAVIRPRKREADAESGPVERYSQVTVMASPRPAPAPASPPEVVLPNITYPELPPSEEPERRATVRRSRRTAGRPLLLVGSAAVLVFAGQRFLASRGGPSSQPAAVADAAAPEPAPTPPVASNLPPAAKRATPPARPAPSEPGPQPLVKAPSGPMTPGPAFAASVPARVAPGSPATAPAPQPAASIPAAPAPSAPRSDSTGITPAPTAIEIDVGAALPGESIAPLNNERDTLAIKRILKAVTSRKANPTAP
jgi:hypothetical protein